MRLSLLLSRKGRAARNETDPEGEIGEAQLYRLLPLSWGVLSTSFDVPSPIDDANSLEVKQSQIPHR